MENRRIYLYEGEAPYTTDCGEQLQPSVKEYAVSGARGAVIVCPGGGYTGKAPHEGDPIAEMLTTYNIAGYVLDYRVRPCPAEAPLSDALRAIRLVRSMGYEKVGILGFSAGGHLACSAATLYTRGDPDAADPLERLSSRPDAFIPCYPVVSFISYQHVGSRYSLLGRDGDNMKLVRRFSAELNVTSDTPPAFIWHTSDDDCVPVENSLLLARALSDKRVPFELNIFPHGYHGLGLAGGFPLVSKWPELCGRWLVSLGFADEQK